MGEKILPLIYFINSKKLGDVSAEEVKDSFKENVVNEAVALGYIKFYGKNNKKLCRLTRDGLNLYFSDKGLEKQNKFGWANLIMGIMTVIITILVGIIAYLQYIRP